MFKHVWTVADGGQCYVLYNKDRSLNSIWDHFLLCKQRNLSPLELQFIIKKPGIL